MNKKGCYACKHCEIVRGKPFCRSGARPIRLTEKQCTNKYGYCKDFHEKEDRKEE